MVYKVKCFCELSHSCVRHVSKIVRVASKVTVSSNLATLLKAKTMRQRKI